MKRLMALVSCLLLLAGLAGCSGGGESPFWFEVTDGVAELVRYTGNGQEVEIPDKYEDYEVASIGARAFYNCSNLKKVILPSSVVALGDEAFALCPSMIEFAVDEENAAFTAMDGVLFSKDLKTLVRYPEGKEGEYSIPDGVTTVDQQAFSRCNKLSGVTMPSSLTTIKAAAFYDCKTLKSVSIPDKVTTIGPTAFCRCVALTELTLPSGLTKLETGVLSDCTALKTLKIPGSVTEIADAAFWNCTALASFTVDADNTALKAVDGVLFSADGSTLIRYPAGKTGESYAIPDGVTSISSEAFSYNAQIKSIVLPGRLGEIADSAFYLCSLLDTVVLEEGITAIGDKAFASCTSLNGLALPSTLQTIGASAFNNNDALNAVELPDGLTTIGDNAFSYCDKLMSVKVPASVTSVGVTSFAGCEMIRLYGEEGSAIEKYAESADITFNDNDATETTTTTTKSE